MERGVALWHEEGSLLLDPVFTSVCACGEGAPRAARASESSESIRAFRRLVTPLSHTEPTKVDTKSTHLTCPQGLNLECPL